MHFFPKRVPRLIPNRSITIYKLYSDMGFEVVPNAKNGRPESGFGYMSGSCL